MNMRVSIPLFMLLQSAALAQVASVPVLGWTIPEKGRDIERVLGVPGAGHIEAGGSMPIEVSRPVPLSGVKGWPSIIRWSS